jgi:hypothetical protein
MLLFVLAFLWGAFIGELYKLSIIPLWAFLIGMLMAVVAAVINAYRKELRLNAHEDSK